MGKSVEVLDAIMSSGKTNGIMKWIDENPHERYIYVTPLLEEAENRLTNEKYGCVKTKFYSPEREFTTYLDADGNTCTSNSKKTGFIRLLGEDKNISCTHALFMDCTQVILDMIKAKGYVIILDEELDVITALTGYSKGDKDFLLNIAKSISIAADGKVSWVGGVTKDTFKYIGLKKLCDEGVLYSAKRDGDMMVVQLPIGLITSAKRFIILTYLFDGSVLDGFLKINGVGVRKFTDFTVDEAGIKSRIKDLITIVGTDQTRKLRGFSMGYTWYSKPTSDLKKIEKAIRAVCLANSAKAVDVMYTFPKIYAYPERVNGRVIKPNGYAAESFLRGVKDDFGEPVLNKCWIDSACRATNALAHKKLLIHVYNRYPNTSVEAYLCDMGHPVNEDRFALAEMLQWLFRGCIRDKEPMMVCILSERMLLLFKEWLDDV